MVHVGYAKLERKTILDLEQGEEEYGRVNPARRTDEHAVFMIYQAFLPYDRVYTPD
jgi:hypothetical protein